MEIFFFMSSGKPRATIDRKQGFRRTAKQIVKSKIAEVERKRERERDFKNQK